MFLKKKNLSPKVKELKKAIKNKSYNLNKAVEKTAEVICDHPEVLLWR